MKNLAKPQRILWYEHIGFLAIIILSWVIETLELPKRVLGGESYADWRESAVETVLVVVVWVVVYVLTKRLLARLRYLEGFLRVCAYCRKICHDEEWLPLEQYFAKGLEVQTSHSVCPACYAKVMAEEIRST